MFKRFKGDFGTNAELMNMPNVQLKMGSNSSEPEPPKSPEGKLTKVALIKLP